MKVAGHKCCVICIFNKYFLYFCFIKQPTLLLGFFPAWLCPQPPLLPCPQDEPLPWEPVLFHMPPPSSSSSQLEWREAATEPSLSPQPSCIDFEPAGEENTWTRDPFLGFSISGLLSMPMSKMQFFTWYGYSTDNSHHSNQTTYVLGFI